VAKPNNETTFLVEPTEYGWSVRVEEKRLGLFVTQRHALDDVKGRRAELATKGKRSAVIVTAPDEALDRRWSVTPHRKR
jgi:hypothetical protein